MPNRCRESLLRLKKNVLPWTTPITSLFTPSFLTATCRTWPALPCVDAQKWQHQGNAARSNFLRNPDDEKSPCAQPYQTTALSHYFRADYDDTAVPVPSGPPSGGPPNAAPDTASCPMVLAFKEPVILLTCPMHRAPNCGFHRDFEYLKSIWIDVFPDDRHAGCCRISTATIPVNPPNIMDELVLS